MFFSVFQIGLKLYGVHGGDRLGKLVDGIKAHIFGFAIRALQTAGVVAADVDDVDAADLVAVGVNVVQFFPGEYPQQAKFAYLQTALFPNLPAGAVLNGFVNLDSAAGIAPGAIVLTLLHENPPLLVLHDNAGTGLYNDRITVWGKSHGAHPFIQQTAYYSHSLANECERGKVDETRIWWVQAESVLGFVNLWLKYGEPAYRDAAADIFHFIEEKLVDKRPGSEWFWSLDAQGNPIPGKPIVEPWKCPYHNGRMCMELIRKTRCC